MTSPSPSTSAALHERAERRWTSLLAERPDLAPAIALQRKLVSRTIELCDALDRDAVSTPLTGDDAAALLARGIPFLRGTLPPEPPHRLANVLRDYLSALTVGEAKSVASHVKRAMDEGRLNAGSWLAASFTRDERAIRSGAIELGVAPDVLWLVGDLTTAPWAAALRNRFIGAGAAAEGHDLLAGAMAKWDRGFCPACGSWPAYCEIVGGRHNLRCSFCGSAWAKPLRPCVYCSNQDSSYKNAVVMEVDAGRRLELCDSCGGYLKVIDAPEPTPFQLLPVQDLATADLDALAAERGFGRPPLPTIPGAVTTKPPCGGM